MLMHYRDLDFESKLCFSDCPGDDQVCFARALQGMFLVWPLKKAPATWLRRCNIAAIDGTTSLSVSKEITRCKTFVWLSLTVHCGCIAQQFHCYDSIPVQF